MLRHMEFKCNTIYTDKETVSCSGEQGDHPKVYIKVPGICRYCEIKFEKNESIRDNSKR